MALMRALDVKRRLEFADHHPDERVTAVGIAFEAAEDDLVQTGRQIAIQLQRCHEVGAIHLLRQYLSRRIPRKRLLVGQQLIRRDPVGEHIHPVADRLAQQLLGGMTIIYSIVSKNHIGT